MEMNPCDAMGQAVCALYTVKRCRDGKRHTEFQSQILVKDHCVPAGDDVFPNKMVSKIDDLLKVQLPVWSLWIGHFIQ